MLCALGASLEEIGARLVAGDQSGFVPRDDLVPGESGLYGAVTSPLPEIPGALSAFDCRNNQLALAALDAIREPVERAIDAHGAHRVGVVVGTSTSGFAETEAAFHARARSGELPDSFDLAQLEFGGLAEFVARSSGAEGPC